MSTPLHRPGSLASELRGQSTLQNIQWEVSQSNLNLVATKEALEKHGVRVQEGLRDVSDRLDSMDQTLVQGVITLHTDLMSIEGSVHDLTAKFDWGITRLEAGIGGVRDLLEDLIRLAKTPEQTWALEQYGIALDAFSRDLYPESLEHIERAINGFEGHTGYKLEHRFHRLLGMILRTDTEVRDFPKAENAYLNAARYAGDRNKWDAALALTVAGYVAYEQGKIDAALGYTKRALTLADITEAKYHMAKFLIHHREISPALDYHGRAIEADPLYSVKWLADKDFLTLARDVHAAISTWRNIVADKCKIMGTAAEDTVLHLKNVTKTCEQALQANVERLTIGGRFTKLRSMTFGIEGPKGGSEILNLAEDPHYLVVRDAYEGRSDVLNGVAAYGNRILEGIASAQSVLNDDLTKQEYWRADPIPQIISAVFAVVPAALWFLFFYPSSSDQWIGFIFVNFSIFIVIFFLVLAAAGEKRESRRNQLAQQVITQLNEPHGYVEKQLQELGKLFSKLGSASPHTILDK